MAADRHSSELQPSGSAVSSQIQSLSDQLRRLAEQWGRFPSLLGDSAEVVAPLADIEETDDAYLVEMELAGVNRDDIEISLDGPQLLVTGERKDKQRVGILRRRTRVTGRFRYDVTLPNIDPDTEVTASYDNGVLTVRVPKPARERRRRIPVT